MAVKIVTFLVLMFSFVMLGCSTDEELTPEQQFFHHVASILADSPDENLTQEEAIDWLLEEMRDLAPTNRAEGAVADLELEKSVDVLLWKTYEDGTRAYEVTIRTEKGKTLRWAVDGYGWTYRNDEARKWLENNDYLDTCDSVRDFGEEKDEELYKILGEGCRIALEGGDVDPEPRERY